MSNPRYRYPGTRPFTTEEQSLFFGRSADLAAIASALRLRDTLTLFGPSGLGKSSLLEAGLLPRLTEAGYLPIRVRLGHYQGESDLLPPAYLYRAMPPEASTPTFLHTIEAENPSLWQACKTLQVLHHQRGQGDLTILLVFDQFEELFSYPTGQKALAREVAALVNDAMPRSFRQQLDERSSELSEVEWALLDTPLTVKALFSVRADRLSLLDRLSEPLPTILTHRYELKPLDRKQATEAMLAPARLEGDFASPRFTYALDAQVRLLDYLSRNDTQPVEPFQLQLLCQHLEEQVQRQGLQAEWEGLPALTRKDLPDFDQLLGNYYEVALGKISDEDERQRARRLIEDSLLLPEEERRLRVDEGQLMREHAASPDLLDQLVDIRLLRAEPNRQGGRSFELSHDTLIAPVLGSRAERKGREAAVARQADAQAQFQRRLRQVLISAGLLLLLTGGVLSFLLWTKNQELQAVSNQILRAYSELGVFLSLEKDDPAVREADLLNQARDLTSDLARAKQALQSRVKTFQAEAEKLKVQLDREDLRPEELKQLMKSYQEKVDSLVVENEVIEIKPREVELQRLLNLPPEQAQSEIEARLGEAQRLEQRGRLNQAMLAYQDVLLLDSSNVVAKAAVFRPTPPLSSPPDASSATTNIEKYVQQRLLAAQQALAAEDPAQALTLYDQILAQDPDHQAAKAGRRQAQALLDQQTARQDSLAARQARLDKALALADRYAQEGSWEAALTAYQDVLAIEPGNVRGRTGQQRAQDSLEARQARLDRALALADRYAREERWEAALAAYKNVLTIEPSHVKGRAGQQRAQDSLGEIAARAARKRLSDQIPLPGMIRIPGGNFQMGSERGGRNEQPVHAVTVSTFYLAETEVTFAQYDAFCEATGSAKPDDEGWGRGNRPVINVSWHDAQAYCQWVSQKTGQRYRLPTEAEWEYAAGGGSSGRSTYAGTNRESSLRIHAVYAVRRSSPVKSKQPNPLGLYDMSGNVWEWCQDRYGSYPKEPQTNPTGPSDGSERVIRGGDWSVDAARCRSACRVYDSPARRGMGLGFRLAR